MFLNSLFLDGEIEKEKNVIMEEINMYQDSPEDLVYELLNEIMFKKTPLEYPILGIDSSIINLNKDKILKYFYENYNPEDIIISIVGKFDEKKVNSQLNNTFGKFNIGNSTKDVSNIITYNFTNNIKGINKNFEQLNLCIGMNGVNSMSDDIYPILILNNIFGGSMSSKLFQRLREDEGLVYDIDSHMTAYKDIGIFTIYAGLNSENLIKSIKLIDEEIRKIKKSLITKDELSRSKDQLKGNYILAMESTFNRMMEIGKSTSQFHRIETIEEVIKKIDNVKMDDIERVVNHIFQNDSFNIAYVGELDEQETVEEEIKEILFG
jgi:predicted Zn-dependent peptidase